MDSNSILVLGAGELGMAVLRGLARTVERSPGTALSVLLRPSTIDSPDPAKRREHDELRSLGVRLIPGDLSGPESDLAAIFRRHQTIIGCTGFVGGRGTQARLARAVLDAGVRRYIPWQFGVDYDVIGRGSAQDLFDEQLDVRDLLRSQGRTEWLIISTGMFTSFLFEPWFGVVDLARSQVHALGSWETAVTVTTAEDIGRLTAEILFADPRIVDRVVPVAGDTITYGRLAEIVESVTGRAVERSEWTVPFLEQDLAGDPDDPLKKYRVVFGQGRGVAWPVEGTFNGERGIRVVGAEEWARANLK